MLAPMGTHARRRSYRIPAVTTLGVTMTGCVDIGGDWELTRFAGVGLPIEDLRDPSEPGVTYGGSGRLEVTSPSKATLTMSISYQYETGYTYTIPLTYGASVASLASRRYTIEVTLDELYAVLFQLSDAPIGDDFAFTPEKSLDCTLNTDEALMCADQDLAAWDFER